MPPAKRKTVAKQSPQKKAESKRPSTYARSHRLSGKKLQFLLKAEEETLRERAAAAGSGRAAKTLVKEGRLRATLMAVKRGTLIKQHQVEGPVSIQCLRGNVAIDAGGDETELTAGGLLVLDKKVPHDLKAMRDSTVLITLSHPGGR